MKSKYLLFCLIFLAGAAEARKGALSPVGGTGFVCTAASGEVRRMNIDLKRSMYQTDVTPLTKLAGITDRKISFFGQNPDLLTTPMGPVLYVEELDRHTLVLTISTTIPDRNVQRRTDYQCVAGQPIDFVAGRQF